MQDDFQGEDLNSKRSKWSMLAGKKPLLIALAVLIVSALTTFAWFMSVSPNGDKARSAQTEKTTSKDEKTAASAEAIAVSHAPDHTKLPLGDSKYSSTVKKGYVFTCQSSFNGGGAFAQGPWINTSAKTWDLTKKASVDGSVSWPTAFWNTGTSGLNRSISSKDLPVGHTTGTFPISAKDDAYSYDRNPNSIKEQTISFNIPLSPTVQASPQCIGGEVGIATTGVLIFSAFDAGGKDAVATEIQDTCEGHPQAGSYYHYHGYSDCFKDTSKEGEHSILLGYAFDGFGIYGIKGQDGKELSSDDLDECHGHTHTVTWDGKQVSMYHYHFTHDFPYTVACFRGNASVKALSSGEGAGGQQQGQKSGQKQGPPQQGPPPDGPPVM